MRRLFAEQSARLDRLFDKYTAPAPSTVAGVASAPTAAASVAPAVSTAASVVPVAAPSAAASATTTSSTTTSIASLTPHLSIASVSPAPVPSTAALRSFPNRIHTVELSPDPAAARAQSDAVDTPRHHAAALVTAAPVLLTPGAPRPSLQYQPPQDGFDSPISVTCDDDVAYCSRLPTRAPPGALQVLASLGVNNSRVRSADADDSVFPSIDRDIGGVRSPLVFLDGGQHATKQLVPNPPFAAFFHEPVVSLCLTSSFPDRIRNPCAEDDGANDPNDPGPKFASQTSFRIRGGAEVADLFRKLGFNGAEDIAICHSFQFPDSGFALTSFLRGGVFHRFEHGVSAAAFLPKPRGGTCSTALPDPPDATVRRAIHVRDDVLLAASEALAEQATKENFVKAYELVLASRLPRPDDFIKDAESCMYMPTKCSSFERRVSASTAASTRGKLDQMLKRYITDSIPAYPIGVVIFYSASETHGVQRVVGKLISQCPMPFWPFSAPVALKAPWSPFMLFQIKGDAVHLRTIPWTFFCGYAVPVHLETSLSVNTMLADSTQLCFGLWSLFYWGWFAVQSSGSVVQFVVWPILMHEISAANMEHFLVSVQHKGELLNPDAVFHKPLSGLHEVLNYYGCSKENVLSVMLVMPKRILLYMVQNELWLGDYVSIFASGTMSLWPSWVQGDNQHQPWPPPEELRLTTHDAELGPVQCSIMCQSGRIWKPPWHVPLQQDTTKLQPSQIVDVFGQKIPETLASSQSNCLPTSSAVSDLKAYHNSNGWPFLEESFADASHSFSSVAACPELVSHGHYLYPACHMSQCNTWAPHAATHGVPQWGYSNAMLSPPRIWDPGAKHLLSFSSKPFGVIQLQQEQYLLVLQHEQYLRALSCHVDVVCPDKETGEKFPTAIHDFEGDQTYIEKPSHDFILTTSFEGVDASSMMHL